MYVYMYNIYNSTHTYYYVCIHNTTLLTRCGLHLHNKKKFSAFYTIKYFLFMLVFIFLYNFDTKS